MKVPYYQALVAGRYQYASDMIIKPQDVSYYMGALRRGEHVLVLLKISHEGDDEDSVSFILSRLGVGIIFDEGVEP